MAANCTPGKRGCRACAACNPPSADFEDQMQGQSLSVGPDRTPPDAAAMAQKFQSEMDENIKPLVSTLFQNESVRIVGLQDRHDLNGSIGEVVGFAEDGRRLVKVVAKNEHGEEEILRLATKNLLVVNVQGKVRSTFGMQAVDAVQAFVEMLDPTFVNMSAPISFKKISKLPVGDGGRQSVEVAYECAFALYRSLLTDEGWTPAAAPVFVKFGEALAKIGSAVKSAGTATGSEWFSIVRMAVAVLRTAEVLKPKQFKHGAMVEALQTSLVELGTKVFQQHFGQAIEQCELSKTRIEDSHRQLASLQWQEFLVEHRRQGEADKEEEIKAKLQQHFDQEKQRLEDVRAAEEALLKDTIVNDLGSLLCEAMLAEPEFQTCVHQAAASIVSTNDSRSGCSDANQLIAIGMTLLSDPKQAIIMGQDMAQKLGGSFQTEQNAIACALAELFAHAAISGQLKASQMSEVEQMASGRHASLLETATALQWPEITTEGTRQSLLHQSETDFLKKWGSNPTSSQAHLIALSYIDLTRMAVNPTQRIILLLTAGLWLYKSLVCEPKLSPAKQYSTKKGILSLCDQVVKLARDTHCGFRAFVAKRVLALVQTVVKLKGLGDLVDVTIVSDFFKNWLYAFRDFPVWDPPNILASEAAILSQKLGKLQTFFIDGLHKASISISVRPGVYPAALVHSLVLENRLFASQFRNCESPETSLDELRRRAIAAHLDHLGYTTSQVSALMDVEYADRNPEGWRNVHPISTTMSTSEENVVKVLARMAPFAISTDKRNCAHSMLPKAAAMEAELAKLLESIRADIPKGPLPDTGRILDGIAFHENGEVSLLFHEENGGVPSWLFQNSVVVKTGFLKHL